jgi:predicted PurR-regulated permease PerM
VAALSQFTESKLTSPTSQKIIAAGVVIAIFHYAQAVVITFLCSLLCACLLEPVVGKLVHFRVPRAVASVLVCLLTLAGLYLIAGLSYSRGVVFVESLPAYEQSIRQVVENVRQRIERLENAFARLAPQRQQPIQQVIETIEAQRPRAKKTTRQAAPPEPAGPPPVQEVRVRDEEGLVSRYVLPRLGFFYEFVLFASFVPFLVYFMLSWKDHMRYGFTNLFPIEHRQVVHKTLSNIGAMMRTFMVGNFLIAVLLASLSSLVFWYLRIPFAFMMGAISGTVSIIPYAGLPLALIPPLFAALGIYNSFSSYLLIIGFVAGLHLLALNVLYPKLVGRSVHLNPLTVTISILIWTWMWGPIGLLLSIPITASLKAVCDNVPALRSYGELLGD